MLEVHTVSQSKDWNTTARYKVYCGDERYC